MTQEEKQLLLKDLLSKQLYGVKAHYQYYDFVGGSERLIQESESDGVIEGIDLTLGNPILIDGFHIEVENVKPYLRPMSSMTVKEEYEYHQCKNFNYLDICEMEHEEILETTALCFSRATDWLDKNKFDYRGLIPMGLALEAPEDMYKTE